MKRRGRPPKDKSIVPAINQPIAANNSLLLVALEMAKGLKKVYTDSKLSIANKYRNCPQFQQGVEYKIMISREIGKIEGIEQLINEIESLIKEDKANECN